MDEMILARNLRDSAEKFRLFAANTPTPEGSSIVDLHLRLADFILERPLARAFDFPDPDRLPSFLREIVRTANSAFRIQQPREMRTMLESLIALTGHLQNEKSGIAKVLNLAARQWNNAIKDLRNPACLHLALSPSLDLEVRERELRPLDGGDFISEVPLAITNSGLLPAYDALLTILAIDGVEGLGITPAKLVRAGTWQLEIDQEVLPGRPILVVLQVRQRIAASLELITSFTRYAPDATGGQSNRLRINFIVPGEAPLDESRNPFRPDLPLTPLTADGDWTPLMKDERELLAAEILADPLLDSGRIYVIRGVRRSGKTSLLLGLREKMNTDGAKFLPVYIDISLWYLTLQEKAVSIDDVEGLLYELADSAARKAMLFLSEEEEKKATEIEELLARTQDMKLEPSSFGILMDKLRASTGRKVVFLLDELDWWIKKEPFKGDAQALLAYLAGFSRSSHCSIVLAHDWTTRGWDAPYGEDDKLLPIPKRIKFLEKGAFDSLIRSMPRQVTAVASEFLWKFTGGWPGLAQLICFEVSEALKKEDMVVDEWLAKEVAERTLASKDWQPFLNSLMASFSETEISLMSWATENRLIDLSSSAIRGLLYLPGRTFKLTLNDSSLGLSENDINDAIRALVDKQILELSEQHEVALRVGAFAYSSLLALYTTSEAVA
jgi:hypothetical protein